MTIFIITLFPGLFDQLLKTSILGRALNNSLIKVNVVDLKDFSENKRKSVDSPPYGGGPGMVIEALPLLRAVDYSQKQLTEEMPKKKPAKVILMTPQGSLFNQKKAHTLSKENSLIIVCGHYAGVDQRFIDIACDEEISIGDFILTGGEIPAMAILDATARLLPDVLGNPDSVEHDSFSKDNCGMLQGPLYTRPARVKNFDVPDVLMSGNHGEIQKWRWNQSKNITHERRPELTDENQQC
mgnify:CR=1 FL=1|jgi:tRNA (guanine37-N1)-methyltransferase|tara:strand:- start:68 stop:787 length:720 start_codon:yes stop_codon:yes gene_type:complete